MSGLGAVGSPLSTGPCASWDDGAGDAVVDAAMAGDHDAFARLVERYRRDVHGHCLRMLRSFEQAEDVVQETFLRAWRARAGFAGRATVRTWLYQIATNACLDEIKRSARRSQVRDAPSPDLASPDVAGDGLLPGPVAATPGHAQPDAALVAKETIELGLASAFALLSPRQRTALILRDVLRWSAGDAAEVLGTTVPAVNSALQRARATLDAARPSRDAARPPGPRLDPHERALAQRCGEALARADWATVVELVRADAVRGCVASAPPS